MIHYLVDVSWMLYRGFYACSKIWDNYPEIHFLCKKIESLLSRKDAVVHLCLDGFATKGKKLLGEKYKAGRHQDGGYNVYSGLSSLVHSLHNDRIKVYYNKNYESDEIIFTLSRTLDGRKKILSGDKDLLQSLKSDVVIESTNGQIITDETYKFEYADKFFELDPSKLPIFRAIAGDPSDSLKPPVARFPRKLAAKLAESFNYEGEAPTIEQLNEISSNLSNSEKNWVSKLIDSYNDFNTNFEIMKLNIIKDDIEHNDYSYPEVQFDEFIQSKIDRLNSL